MAMKYPTKKKWTDEERHELVKQMDADLEQFIKDKVEANKDRPREKFDIDKTLAVSLS